MSLTRISRLLFVATAKRLVSAALRSVRFLDVGYEYVWRTSRRAPCSHRPLRHFATISGEKRGLRRLWVLIAFLLPGMGFAASETNDVNADIAEAVFRYQFQHSAPVRRTPWPRIT